MDSGSMLYNIGDSCDMDDSWRVYKLSVGNI